MDVHVPICLDLCLALCDGEVNQEPVGVELVLPEGVREVGEYAFERCTALGEFAIPSTLIVVDKTSFANCPAKKAVQAQIAKNKRKAKK